MATEEKDVLRILDTESNILAALPKVRQIAFATDTNDLILRKATSTYLKWASQGSDSYHDNVSVGFTSSPTTREKLDINGALILGDATNANAGTIKYASGVFSFRDADSWITLQDVPSWVADITEADISNWDNAYSHSVVVSGNPHSVSFTELDDNPTDYNDFATGFTNPNDVVMTYDPSARTVTISSMDEAYYKGNLVAELTDAFESDPHDDTTGHFTLWYNGSDVVWSNTDIDEMTENILIFHLYKNGITLPLRECHGFMPRESHYELHHQIGTFTVSGGDFSGYTPASTTAAERRPNISQLIIQDEDLPTTLPALTSEVYAQYYLTSTDTASELLDQSDIIALSTARPYYNLYTGGNWTQELMDNNYHAKIFVIAIPVTSDTVSQKKRFMFIQPQSQSLSLTVCQGVSPADINMGDLQEELNEFVFCGEIIIKYTSANWSIVEINKLTGNKNFQQSTSQGSFLSTISVDGTTITGDGTSGDPLSAIGIEYTDGNDDYISASSAGGYIHKYNNNQEYCSLEANTNGAELRGGNINIYSEDGLLLCQGSGITIKDDSASTGIKFSTNDGTDSHMFYTKLGGGVLEVLQATIENAGINLPTGSSFLINDAVANIPTGGTAGQYISKVDGTNFNVQWSSLTFAHNDTTSKDGGTTGEYYHLTSAQHTLLTGIDSGDISNWDGAEPALGNPGTNGYVLASTTAGVRSWVSNPAPPWVDQGSGLFYSGGGVGIGTTPYPGSTFHTYKVAGSNITIIDTYSVNSVHCSYTHYRKSHSDTPSQQIATVDTELLGAVYFSGNNGTGFIEGGFIKSLQVGAAGGGASIPAKLQFGTSNGTTYDTKLEISPSGDIYTKELSSGATPASGYGNWYCKTDSLAYYKNDAGTEYLLSAWKPSGSDIYYSAGNVGIGTTTPTSELDVNGVINADSIATTGGASFTGNVGIGIAAAASIFGFRLYEPSSAGAYSQWMNSTTGTGSSDGFVLGIDNNEDAVLINNEATRMAFATTGVERMVISAVGDIFTKELSSGATPTSGHGNWYCKTDGLPYFKDDAGTEYDLTYTSGSFTWTITGCTAGETVTVYWQKTKNIVTLSWYNIVGTSNSTSCTLTGLPTALRVADHNPSAGESTVDFVVMISDGGLDIIGKMVLTSGTSTVTLTKLDVSGTVLRDLGSDTFTDNGLKGLKESSITYSIG